MIDSIRNRIPRVRFDRWAMVLVVSAVVLDVVFFITGVTTLGLPIGLSIAGVTRAYFLARMDQLKLDVVNGETLWAENDRKLAKGEFCKDCGRRFVPWKRQHGFDPETGKPNMLTTMACPGWDREKAESERREHYSSLNSYGLLDHRMPELRVTCGQVVTSAERAEMHTNHPPNDVTAGCAGCIEDMVSQGIIDRAAANKLRKMASA